LRRVRDLIFGNDMELSISDWIQISISVSTFLAIVVALFGERIRWWLYGPSICVKFDRKNERCFRWAIVLNDQLQDQGVLNNVKRQYFRLRVNNCGFTTARQIKAKVELYFADRNLADRFEPSTLHWISGLDALDLAPKEDWYLDLLSQVIDPLSAKYKLRIELANKTPRGIAWDRYLETYILKVSLHAENLPSPIIKFFRFNPVEGQPGHLEEIRL